MYKRILVPLENSPADRAILEHVVMLARHDSASLVLIHVADGFAARNLKQLSLRESDEMRKDRAYLDATVARLAALGVRGEDPRIAPEHALRTQSDPAEAAVALEHDGRLPDLRHVPALETERAQQELAFEVRADARDRDRPGHHATPCFAIRSFNTARSFFIAAAKAERFCAGAIGSFSRSKGGYSKCTDMGPVTLSSRTSLK